MARIGIYGGSFDPPHVGHIRGAEAAVKELALDELVFVPAREVPGKNRPMGSATPEQRLQMLRLATEDSSILKVSDWN